MADFRYFHDAQSFCRLVSGTLFLVPPEMPRVQPRRFAASRHSGDIVHLQSRRFEGISRHAIKIDQPAASRPACYAAIIGHGGSLAEYQQISRQFASPTSPPLCQSRDSHMTRRYHRPVNDKLKTLMAALIFYLNILHSPVTRAHSARKSGLLQNVARRYTHCRQRLLQGHYKQCYLFT